MNDKEIFKKVSKDLNEAYEWARKELGADFDKMMAELAVIITDMQYKMKDGTSHVAAAMIMCVPEETDKEDFEDEEERENYLKMVKAAAVWMILNKPEI